MQEQLREKAVEMWHWVDNEKGGQLSALLLPQSFPIFFSAFINQAHDSEPSSGCGPESLPLPSPVLG